MALITKSRIVVTFFVLVCLAARPQEAAAQYGMSFSYYFDIAWDGSTVYGYVSGYDGSWGCSHGGYYSYGSLSGPNHGTSGEEWGIGSSLSVGFGGDDGTWTLSIGTVFECSCVGTTGAGGSQQQPVVRTPTSLSVTFDQTTTPSGYLYFRERHYQVRDQFGNAMQVSGMAVTENYSNVNGNCHSGSITTGGGNTNGSGEFRDDYYLSGSPPNPCTTTATQRHYVNGNQVSSFGVTWTYTAVSIQ